MLAASLGYCNLIVTRFLSYSIGSNYTHHPPAFADDLAFSIHDGSFTLPRLMNFFQAIQDNTGLWIKMRKCVFLLYRHDTAELWREWVRSHLPLWADIPVALFATYLGDVIGIDAGVGAGTNHY